MKDSLYFVELDHFNCDVVRLLSGSYRYIYCTYSAFPLPADLPSNVTCFYIPKNLFKRHLALVRRLCPGSIFSWGSDYASLLAYQLRTSIIAEPCTLELFSLYSRYDCMQYLDQILSSQADLHHINVARYNRLSAKSLSLRSHSSLDLPCDFVIKPDDRTHQGYQYRVKDDTRLTLSSILDHLPDHFTPDHQLLVQEFIPGQSLSLDLLLSPHKTLALLVGTKSCHSSQPFATQSVFFTPVSPLLLTLCQSLASLLASRLLRVQAFHLELVYDDTSGVIHIIDLVQRLPGSFSGSILFPHLTNLDPVRLFLGLSKLSPQPLHDSSNALISSTVSMTSECSPPISGALYHVNLSEYGQYVKSFDACGLSANPFVLRHHTSHSFFRPTVLLEDNKPRSLTIAVSNSLMPTRKLPSALDLVDRYLTFI